MATGRLFDELGVVGVEIGCIRAGDPLKVDAEVLGGVLAALLHRAEKRIPERAAVHDDVDLVFGSCWGEVNAGRHRAQTGKSRRCLQYFSECHFHPPFLLPAPLAPAKYNIVTNGILRWRIARSRHLESVHRNWRRGRAPENSCALAACGAQEAPRTPGYSLLILRT